MLFALCFSLCFGLWQRSRQRELSEQVIRLHVIARSDSSRDQAVKLKVRDSVLRLLEPALEGIDDQASAAEVVEELIPRIEQTAAKAVFAAGEKYSAAAGISRESYPTRQYDGFALPAGEYTSLRIILGDGNGKNWWCVVFPPLCAAAVEESCQAVDMLSEDSEAMILAEDGEYKISFKVLEIFEKLRQLFN